ncbi:hypothetical protein FHS38_007062 [Streptomyces netropsis]|uniref:Uncharacterized protein n=1 Tax=Streptomyces netropsis TaxID=55404 RepID=A0A7W7LJ19_STRNE|nr:hypothetical protein [Streptomyces netropsis]MBB4890969.1 hypothetical protein [Streptomyces netropsis]
MAGDAQGEARQRLSNLVDGNGLAADGNPARRLEEDAALLGRLLAAAGPLHSDGQMPDMAEDDMGAGLGLLTDMRLSLDRLEAQAVMEARRQGMDWRQIAQHQGLNSSQAASQRYQRLVTRLEEIRQGVR